MVAEVGRRGDGGGLALEAPLAVALYRGALPALEELALDGSPAFGVVKAIVYQALAWSRASST